MIVTLLDRLTHGRVGNLMRLRRLLAIESFLRLPDGHDVAGSCDLLRVLSVRRWHHMNRVGSWGLRLDHLLAIH